MKQPHCSSLSQAAHGRKGTSKTSDIILNWLNHNIFTFYSADAVQVKNMGSMYMARDRNIFLAGEFTQDIDRKDIVSDLISSVSR